MAVQQMNADLEQRLDELISGRTPCVIVVTRTDASNTLKNDFKGRTGLRYHGERKPSCWATQGQHILPEAAAYARRELKSAMAYKEEFDGKIQIEILDGKEFEKRYQKMRSVYGA